MNAPAMTHWVGDDCAPDGHRGAAPDPSTIDRPMRLVAPDTGPAAHDTPTDPRGVPASVGAREARALPGRPDTIPSPEREAEIRSFVRLGGYPAPTKMERDLIALLDEERSRTTAFGEYRDLVVIARLTHALEQEREVSDRLAALLASHMEAHDRDESMGDIGAALDAHAQIVAGREP